jgi:hypothetical protein
MKSIERIFRKPKKLQMIIANDSKISKKHLRVYFEAPRVFLRSIANV